MHVIMEAIGYFFFGVMVVFAIVAALLVAVNLIAFIL
jgi:hypothetical protein